MKYLNNIEEVVIYFRKILAKQAEMNIDDIINADTITGPELTKIVNNEKIPYNNENIIIFELIETNEFDLNAQMENDNILDISSHRLHLVIYGDNCRTLSRKLKARMLSQKVINDLQNNGISLNSISNIEATSEFINQIRYLRRDFSINFIISLNVENVEEENKIENISQMRLEPLE